MNSFRYSAVDISKFHAINTQSFANECRRYCQAFALEFSSGEAGSLFIHAFTPHSPLRDVEGANLVKDKEGVSLCFTSKKKKEKETFQTISNIP